VKSLYLNPETGDIEFDAQNNIRMVEDREEESQSIKLLLSTNTGEWFLNTLHGLAYEYLQVKNPSEARVRAELLKALEQEERVAEVQDIQINFDRSDRCLTILFKVRMQSGEVIADEVVV